MVESRELARSHLKRFREFCQLSSCFSWRGAKFFSSLHKSLSLFTNHLAAHHSAPAALLDQVGMPPLDLLPPASAPLRRRPLRVGVFPSLSLPSLFFRGIGRCFSDGQRPRSALPSGDAFIVNTCIYIQFYVLYVFRYLYFSCIAFLQ